MITRNMNRDAFYAKGVNGDFDILLKDFKMNLSEPLKPFMILPQFECRPDLVALTLYGNSRMWWIIAEINGIGDVWNEFNAGTLIDVPSKRDVENFYRSNISRGIFE